MRRQVAIAGSIIAACCAFPAFAAADVTIVDTTPPDGANSDALIVVTDSTATQFTVTAYTRSRYACIKNKTGKQRGATRTFDALVAGVASGAANEPTTVTLSPPPTPAAMTCRSGERVKRLRTSFTDITARNSAGAVTSLAAGDFLVGE
jgi:hypothetical protein